MIRFGQLDRLTHPAAGDPANLTAAKNLDRSKEGQISVRDGLARPANWPGIFLTQDGLEVTTTAKSDTFGQAIRSLIPVDRPGATLPVLTFGD